MVIARESWFMNHDRCFLHFRVLDARKRVWCTHLKAFRPEILVALRPKDGDRSGPEVATWDESTLMEREHPSFGIFAWLVELFECLSVWPVLKIFR